MVPPADEIFERLLGRTGIPVAIEVAGVTTQRSFLPDLGPPATETDNRSHQLTSLIHRHADRSGTPVRRHLARRHNLVGWKSPVGAGEEDHIRIQIEFGRKDDRVKCHVHDVVAVAVTRRSLVVGCAVWRYQVIKDAIARDIIIHATTDSHGKRRHGRITTDIDQMLHIAFVGVETVVVWRQIELVDLHDNIRDRNVPSVEPISNIDAGIRIKCSIVIVK